MSLPINEIVCGDCKDIMATWPEKSINCCVTSPPYWGLRDYGVDGQLGLEKTPEEYVAKMVAVFAEVKRVLRDDGTLWLNLGDSYGGSGMGISYAGHTQGPNACDSRPLDCRPKVGHTRGKMDKQLMGMPWRVAFALQANGWVLRQDIIWHKPNPMPESVKDRCTKAHEYIFLLSKKAKYYCDMEAIKEDAQTEPHGPGWANSMSDRNDRQVDNESNQREWAQDGKKNKRSVWTVTTKGYKKAHFATFPPDLIEPCILVGCPKDGVVLDPFMGSGTTAMVAYENNRNYVGCELNPEYIKLNRAKKAQEKYGLFE